MTRTLATVAVLTALATQPACCTAFTGGGKKVTAVGLTAGVVGDLVVGFMVGAKVGGEGDHDTLGLLTAPLALFIDFGILYLLAD